jgi:hypothetical protein
VEVGELLQHGHHVPDLAASAYLAEPSQLFEIDVN